MKFISNDSLRGILVGSLLTGAIAFGVSIAHGESEDNAAFDATSCQFDLGAPMITSGTQCFGNRVMVGIINGNLYCAMPKITCPQK